MSIYILRETRLRMCIHCPIGSDPVLLEWPLNIVEALPVRGGAPAHWSEWQRQTRVIPPFYNFICQTKVLKDGSSQLRNPENGDAFSFWVLDHLLKFLFLIVMVVLILEAE